MKVKDVVEDVCIFLGKEEILNSNLFKEQGEQLSEQDASDVDLIVECLNNITSEIASDYIPILKQKDVKFSDGRINISSIDNKIQEIISIKSSSGNNFKYKYIGNQIVCLASNATITYKVYPNTLTLDGDAETFGNRLSARVLAYGVASEYCYLQMLHDDAALWENRFKNALLFSGRKKGEIKLKQRGWY